MAESHYKHKLTDAEKAQKKRAAEAVLSGMLVNMYTMDENKDSDTRLEIWINLSGERQAAYVDVGNTKEFPKFTSDTEWAAPVTNIMRKSDIPGSWIQFRIAPVGDDTWRFRFNAELHFTDGSTVRYEQDATIDVDQDNRQYNYYL